MAVNFDVRTLFPRCAICGQSVEWRLEKTFLPLALEE
jgi:hypothetical protein